MATVGRALLILVLAVVAYGIFASLYGIRRGKPQWVVSGRRSVREVTEIAKKLLKEAKVAVSPGIGFGDFGDEHVRFALIENESRLRQAVRGIKEMFRKDSAK